MTDVTHNGGDVGSFTYAYDRYGNRLSETSSNTGTMPSYSINQANNQISGFGYDAAGNITSDGTHSYSYDAEGNLLTVDGGSTATYIYDAKNHRISSSTSAGKFEYVYDTFGHQTFSKPVPISARSRSCSGMAILKRPRSICTCRAST